MEILTVKEASKLLKTSESNLRSLCRAGIIPHRQRGRITFIKERLIEWWLEDHKPMPIELKIKKMKLLRRL
jgi:excisionase family DNA binding protein